jgi:hypothetical protein
MFGFIAGEDFNGTEGIDVSEYETTAHFIFQVEGSVNGPRFKEFHGHVKSGYAYVPFPKFFQ